MNDVVAKAPKKGAFVKGVSGNPAGRPPGSKNQITLLKLQVEGELRKQMVDIMPGIVAEMIRQAMPKRVYDKDGNVMLDETGAPRLLSGDTDMLKTLYKSWVSGTKSTDEDAPKEKIVIQIGRLDDPNQPPVINGQVFEASK